MIRVGLIGAGKIAENAHLPILSALDHARIEWIVDPNMARAQQMAKLYQTTPLETPAYDSVDLVVIAAPLGVRQPYIDACASAGRAVFLEKPIAMTLAAHQGIVSQFAPHRCALGFQRRFYPQVDQLKTIVAQRLFGDLQALQVHQGYFNLKSGGAQHFTQNTALSGGGLLVESAVHILDSALYACDVQQVDLRQRKVIADGRLDFHMQLQGFGYAKASERIALKIESTTLRNLDANGITLNFNHAQVFWSGDPSIEIEIRSQEKAASGTVQTQRLACAKGSINAAFVACWQAVIRALETSTPNASSACTSFATSALIERAYEGL